MANNYTAVPHAYLDECQDLSDAEFGRLMRALLRYSRDGEAMALSGNERFFARRMMNQEDVNREHYRELAERRSLSARNAAMARWHADECERMRSDAEDASTEQYSTEQNR